ncbi:MAG: hypothetical protein KAI71_03315 [Candidatus Pacebacteria bacterium]|nr:hypothetical protein [Candidatus Paceibacterota bacterium]
MNIKKILPIISFILLIGAILSATYFKNLEKEIAKENMKIEKENSANNIESPTFEEK